MTTYFEAGDLTGHAFITLTDAEGNDMTAGFFSLGGAEIFVGRTVNGGVQSPDPYAGNMTDGQISTRYFPITKTDYQSALSVVKTYGSLSNGGGNYNLFTCNCSHFTVEVLRGAGIKAPEYSNQLVSPKDIQAFIRQPYDYKN